MDLNADGYNDILSGSYSRSGQPMAGLFQVLWGQPDGTFKKAALLNGTDDKPLEIPHKDEKDIVESICTRPTAVDWDGDGDLDLVVGNFAGRFYFFTGAGGGKFAPTPQLIKAGDAPPKFIGDGGVKFRPAPELAKDGDAPLQLDGAHGDPVVVDWDKDGDLDLLSGSSNGGVQWAENTAGPKKPPLLKQFATLIAPPADMRGEFRPNEVTAPAVATRVWVADVNGDGKLDILVGDNVTLVAPAAGLSEADFAKRYAEWKAAFAAAQNEASAATQPGNADPEKLQPIYERINKLYEQRKEIMTEERTGFVWVYVQK